MSFGNVIYFYVEYNPSYITPLWGRPQSVVKRALKHLLLDKYASKVYFEGMVQGRIFFLFFFQMICLWA